MGPEDNPADDVQPTKEEWDEYQRDCLAELLARDPGQLDVLRERLESDDIVE